MIFQWKFEKATPQMIKSYVKELGISKGLLAKIKFQGGRIEVNGIEQNVLYKLQTDDLLTVQIPDEQEHETLLVDDTPIDVVYEDEHLLVVNKPAGVASIPAQYHPNGTMANRVKGYLKQKNEPNLVIHIVTRLDRGTSGLMLFAKHGFSHALLDVELRTKKVTKMYQALVSGELEKLATSGEIIAPITRDLSSLLKRKVDESGKHAHTDYWVERRSEKVALVNIQLHTGRTHQIRVHFEHLGFPLLGDEMYAGAMDFGMARQALHCRKLAFIHPFSREEMVFLAELPEDMCKIVEKMN
ncbi:MAG: RluA family pseudouridine synthase [Lactobacillales bacterium]|jgi:23S rRNA pseudouridine1911/1915/1917 synthase|nr:RluA family pseudouridine synthase [Lactobacillales bacterium]